MVVSSMFYTFRLCENLVVWLRISKNN